ncbi:helicase-related protein [Tsukamurella tyrosinosolvens]|uniref:helicase-related protein n=1 Tax=Tsukamurella tyrosinosolvens TaxID=57704 RepID=UPI001CE105ED|nr:helicase-related protein [Tsukamurella tyrosinosolvens]
MNVVDGNTGAATARAGFSGAPGSVVVVRDQEWLVTAVEPRADGAFVHVTGLSELVRETSAVFSTALDRIDEVDPTAVGVIADPSDRFRRSRLWLESMLRKTPVAVTDPSLETARGGLARPLDYQLKAVAKALDPDKLRPRILLADAVGLGKTIEIGMILSELVRRGRGDRILVVTPKHVLEQMQMELWTRFALPFVRLDSSGIQRIRQILPASRNPFTYYKRVIISIDTLKSDRYVAHLRKQRWDAVVIDESHNVTNSASQNNRLATMLAANTDALVLASATPHNGKAESFAELIRMLDPSAVSPTGELDLAEVAKLVIRRHRHHPDVAGEVGDEWAERQPPNNIAVPATAAEDAIARELEDVWLWPYGATPYSGKNSSLFPWTLAKAYLSSPAALAQSIRERLRRLDPTVPAEAAERAALTRLGELTDAVPITASAKYRVLREQLSEIGVSRTGDTRVVVFAERVATLTALAEALAADLKMSRTKGDDLGQVTVLHGGLSDTEQTAIVESFKLEASPIRILVTGDVASEGVNLHSQCHHLIHYDIPWSLIRIEQRNGRIDRYGQRHRPQISTLLLTPSTEHFAGDIRVLTRLLEREHEAHGALGESSSLIGKYDVKAEEEAIRQVLAGQKELDEVVKTVDEVVDGGGIDALFAELALGDIDQDEPVEVAGPANASSGVYESEFAFLSDALLEFLDTPQLPPPSGADWTVHKQHSIAGLTPTPDLVQRLEVLPQDYLNARRVKTTYKLAYTRARGEQELLQARSGESTSTWPEAHYLAPLHPVVDWAADRALAALGRSQIYAVRGDVPFPTVLVQVTQTNTRGQVVAAGYFTVGFPDPADPSGNWVTTHLNPLDAVESLALADVNAGDLTDSHAAQLQPLVAAAVRAVDEPARLQADAVRAETAERIDAWIARADAWQAEAGALIQRGDVLDRRARISEEQKHARAMNPELRLTRPLMIAVPTDYSGTES